MNSNMKLLAFIVFVGFLACIDARRGRHRGHEDLRELCQEDETCIENGHKCFRAFKMVVFDEMRGENRTTRMEQRDACLNETGLWDQYQNFDPRRRNEEPADEDQSPDMVDFEDSDDSMDETEDQEEQLDEVEEGRRDDEGKRHRHHHHHHHGGHRGGCGKRKFKKFMHMLEETAPESARALRCCVINNLDVVNDGAIDKDVLKEKFLTVLTEETFAEQRDAFIGAVDTCGDLVDCKGKEYAKCLVDTCIGRN